jgi:hypothetical protein
MCAGNPTESLAIARARLTPEQWAKFEADFGHFCDYSGFNEDPFNRNFGWAWAKWAYLCGKGL